jgi:hypothetical protein
MPLLKKFKNLINGKNLRFMYRNRYSSNYTETENVPDTWSMLLRLDNWFSNKLEGFGDYMDSWSYDSEAMDPVKADYLLIRPNKRLSEMN